MADPTGRDGDAHGWWQARVRAANDGDPERLVVFASDQHPDGVRVELDAAEVAALPQEQVVCTAVLRDGVVTSLQVTDYYAAGAPPVWFVELPEPDATPPATNLVAFTGLGVEPGELLDEDRADPVPVESTDQLAAIRWWPATGQLDQVYVAPSWRRRHLASLLLAASATLNVARDLPRMWSDGERTALGEELRNARSWRSRAADLTHLAPPMTPEA